MKKCPKCGFEGPHGHSWSRRSLDLEGVALKKLHNHMANLQKNMDRLLKERGLSVYRFFRGYDPRPAKQDPEYSNSGFLNAGGICCYQKIKNGQKINISLSMIVRWAAALDVEIWDLLEKGVGHDFTSRKNKN